MTVVQGLNKLMKGADGLVKKGLKVVPTLTKNNFN